MVKFKTEEVSQTCFVFDVAKFKKLRTRRGMASFLMLSSSKIVEASRIASVFMLSSSQVEEVSQHCFVFNIVKFKS